MVVFSSYINVNQLERVSSSFIRPHDLSQDHYAFAADAAGNAAFAVSSFSFSAKALASFISACFS